MVRIGINGFGRIGRMVVRAFHNDQHKNVEIVAVNDLTDPATLAYLLKYDSVHGRFDGTVSVKEGGLEIDGKHVAVVAEKEPSKLPWKQHGVDLVLECTGRFTEAQKARAHLEAGAKKVIISAPAKGQDVTLCLGINADKYDPAKHTILSNASCTTNCLAPLVKVLHENFNVLSGTMTTVHSYTNDQSILDLPHKDLRRARAAALSMIPTTTGAAKALSEVIPEMKGKLDGFAIRVPTPNVSVVDFTAHVEKKATVEAINEAYKKAAASGPLHGILAVTDEPNVSIDFNGDAHSATVDLKSTMVVNDLVKVVGWYDNETGYATRLYELAKLVASKGL
jgi:glyceraldehyde 3-phosphate dehydrogenase (phosphorylating)